MTELNDDKRIGIEEAANYSIVNKDTIRNWIKRDNGIPAHKIRIYVNLKNLNWTNVLKAV